MAELWVTEHLGFMKDFVSFTMKNSHPFDVSSIEIDLFLSNLAIGYFLPVKYLKTQKELLKHIFQHLNLHDLWKLRFSAEPKKDQYLIELK